MEQRGEGKCYREDREEWNREVRGEWNRGGAGLERNETEGGQG